MNTDMILILGVTASGKGKLAFDLARRIDAEIISVDSMKVYRRMNIGTAKPPLQAQKIVQYHLIDLFEPSDSFSVASFYQIALRQIEQIKNKNKKVIAVGGTALYIKALLYGLFEGPGSNKKIRNELKARAEKEGLGKLHLELEKVDPEAARRIFVNDQRRIIRALEVYKLTGKPISSFQLQFNAEQPKYDWTIIGLRRKKEIENKRINARVKQMIQAGLVEEVRALLAEEKPLSAQAACAIGYAEIIDYLKDQTSLEEAIEKIKINTRHLAKSQRTWFKTFRNVNWIDIAEDQSSEDILQRVIDILNQKGNQQTPSIR